MPKKFIVFILVLACCLGAAGHNIRHYDVTSGLSENTVKGITQDADGYMWLGTQDGLNVFNGKEFTSYGCSYHETAGRLEGSLNILSVLLHQDGKRLWLVCRSTVTLFDPTDHSYQDLAFPGKVLPTCIAYVNEGELWIGTEDGLYAYSETQDSVRRIQMFREPVADEGINAIMCDSKGVVWVCGEAGFFRYLPFSASFEQISNKNALSVMEDTAGVIWVGLWYDGFAKYNPENNQIDILSGEVFRVRSMLEESAGNLLLCTNTGLFRYSWTSGQMKRIFLTSRRTTDNIYSCYKDREGGIWIGTYFNGLYYLLPKDGTIEAFTPENTPEFFHGSAVSSFCEDSRGRIWTGSENGGLSIFIPSGSTFAPLPFDNPAGNIHALCIEQDKLYVGSFAQGLFQIDLGRNQTKAFRMGGGAGTIPDNHVFSLLKLGDGRLLVGTRRGCAVFDPASETFRAIPQLAESFIYAMYKDAGGRIWLADYYDGLHRLDGLDGSYRHYEHKEGDPSSLPSDRLVNIQADDNGTLWISSDGGGLCKYNEAEDSFVPFTVIDGSTPRRLSVVYACLSDKRGNLWISSNDGIWRCDKDGNGKHYTVADGLQSSQFNYSAAYRSSRGRLYFGGINGFNVIDPDVAQSESPQPLVTATVTWSKDSGESFHSPRIIHTGEVVLPRNLTHFDVHFECLSYLSPDNTVFQYSIDNGRNCYSTDKGVVTFANFPYGKHTITVNAITGRGTLSSNNIHIQINNLPPLYLSATAKVLYFVLAILLFLFALLRMARRKQEKAEKEAYQAKLNFFTQIAHEIKTPVTLIRGPLDIILRGHHSEHDQHYLDIVDKNVKRLQELTGELLDFKKISSEGYVLNLKNVNPGQVLSGITGRFGGTKLGLIDIKLEISEGVDECRLDSEAFTKIATNLIGNAAKHTRNLILVELSRRTVNKQEVLHLDVKDNGDGIPPELADKVFDSFYQVHTERAPRAPGVGLGLSLVKLLAEKHNGRAYVDTGYTDGCCVCVDIPFIPVKTTIPLTESEKVESSGIRMLVVEDNPDMLDFLHSTLQEEYSVIDARDGNEALAILRDKDIDIIISDIYMPGGDGFFLLQSVRSDEMLCHLPFVLLSAESALDAKIKGLEYGANAYIEKPFSVEQLLATVKNILKDREIMRRAFQGGDASQPEKAIEQSRDSKFLEKISGMILERMGESWISVEELAENMNVSHSSLQRKIKGLTGLSPIEFIRYVKLAKAAELLASGEYRVNEVCYAVGFSKPSYFSACFKKQFGVLPKDYVKGK